MKSFKSVILAGLCSILILAASPVFAEASATDASSSETSASRIEEVLQTIKDYYLRGVTEEDLVQAAIQGMIDSLDDPYSEYFTASEAKEFFNYINGTDYEMGIYFKAVDNRVKVVEVEEGSAAEKAGIKAGDFILSLNGTKVTVDNLDKVYYEQLPQEDKGKVNVEVLRGLKSQTFVLELEKIEYPMATASQFAGDIGYIGLASFGDRTVAELDKGLADLRAKGMKSLVLDLRGNGGGDVEVAEEVAKRFIDKGTFIHLTDNTGEEYEDVIEGGTPIGIPVYLLVDEGTASASEMLAGMLQDYGIAEVIGMTTYGKGVIQQLQEYEPDGAMLKLTTYEYFTPNHNVVDQVGITPDIEAEDPLSQLFAALREAGAKSFTAQVGADTYTVNGATFDGRIPVIRDKGKIYILARLAAPVLGATAEWKGGKEQALVLTRKGKASKFTLASGKAIQRGDFTYLELGELAKLYPGFTWKDAEEGLILKSAD